MIRSATTYGILIAASAFLLRWFEYRHSIRLFSTELYVVVIAAFFTTIGVWVGNRLTNKRASDAFSKNLSVMKSFGISQREYDVLILLSKGHSNKEIAERLFVSPNTVKTHLSHLYDKLDVSRRTQAIHRSKALQLIP